MISAPAPAKINLALVVGGPRPDGLHEVATILQRIDLCDTVSLEPAAALSVDGFADDTIVRRALGAVAAAAGVTPAWHARIEKRIPVAAGLGGGSSDAATAMKLACALLDHPPPPKRLSLLARELGVDVPFFLEPGPKLGTGDGTILAPLDLPQDYFVLLVLPHGDVKLSTAEVYARFDSADGFEDRGRSCSRSPAQAGRPISPRSRPTTWPARPSRRVSTSSARSAPTSAAPARSCTASSPTGPLPSTPPPRPKSSARAGWPHQRGSVFIEMTSGATVLDKPDSKPGRYLREHKLRLTLWIGAIEGALTLLGVIPHLAVYVLAIVAIVWWAAMGRKYRSSSARHLTWIFAASQAIAVLIPGALHIVKGLAIAALIVAALVGLVVLFAERNKL